MPRLKKTPSKRPDSTKAAKATKATKPKSVKLDLSKAPEEGGIIDDPVRVYLMQMGRIPLLTRDEEVAAAVAIDKARFKYRNTMLATDFMLRGAYEILKQVHRRKLRLDRTIEVSVTNKAEKARILQRLVPNLKTLKHLLAENHKDYADSISKSNKMSDRRAAWQRLVRRRNKCVMLVEACNSCVSRWQRPKSQAAWELDPSRNFVRNCTF